MKARELFRVLIAAAPQRVSADDLAQELQLDSGASVAGLLPGRRSLRSVLAARLRFGRMTAHRREQAYRIRVVDAARRNVAHERGGIERPALVPLRDFLAVEDGETAYRVDRVWPIGGRVLLSAPHKVGKSTLIGNLVRALVDGVRFLDEFDVEQTRSLVLIDDELDERTLRRCLREQGIVNVDAVRLVALRGRVSTFDLLDDETRSVG